MTQGASTQPEAVFDRKKLNTEIKSLQAANASGHRLLVDQHAQNVANMIVSDEAIKLLVSGEIVHMMQ